MALAFAAIPSTVTTLNLTYNGLGINTGAELTVAFAGIPAGVTTLNLSSNDFWRRTGAELQQAFAAIHTGVTTLDLSHNYLEKKTGAELAQAFDGIPSSVITLDLSGNKLDKLSMENMIQVNSSLPSVKTIYLSYDAVLKMDNEKRNALKDIFPNLSNTIFLDAGSNILGVPGANQSPIVTTNPIQRANLARRLGFPAAVEIPSLQSHVAFFAKEKKLNATELPERVQDIVKKS